ncbi:MAG: hypothetical protein WA197_05280 [Candidatus Acidiferrales bacterium]
MARFIEALHIQQRDPGIQAANVALWIEDTGALKFTESLFELLPVHQRHAEIIFADDFGARIGFFCISRFGGFFRGGRVLAGALLRWSRSLRLLILLISMRWPAGSRECACKDGGTKRSTRDAVHSRLNPDMGVFYRFTSGLAAMLPSFSFTVMI